MAVGMNVLTTSYVAASAAMVMAAIYLFARLRLFLTTSTVLVASLLLIFGPAFLHYTLSSGVFARVKSKAPDLDTDAIIIAMNFSVALMYLGILAGIELVDRLMPARREATRTALQGWNSQSLQDDAASRWLLLIVILALLLFMLFISVRENHVGTIRHFFSIKDDNAARNLFRADFGGSRNYFYRVILGAVAPMFVIWGFLSGAVARSWLLILASFALFGVTMTGKIETLSKAPIAFFIFQLLLAALLIMTNRISVKVAILGGLAISLLIFAIVKLVMILPDGTSALSAAYARVFEAESQSLLENFAVFPAVHPFMWGANVRPVAMLLGLPYTPSFSMVANIWYGDPNLTEPSLFIADAWADFSYAGVLVYSVIAGAVCRSIDLAFLARGKTVVAIAVLGATFWGITVLLTTALNIALLSGGLLLAPVLAAMVVAASRYLAKPSRRTGPMTPRES